MSLRTLIARCLGERDALSLAQLQAQRWQPWLQPIRADLPVGEDPGYDDDFQRMREEVNKLSGADVDQVVQLAETLITQRCKDLRVATYYLWARLHKDGEAGLADGLSLLAALLERYADEVLPARSNSRKMALEWLTSGKVLDSLSLFPEVVKDEAERTVAALAWLERGLEAWPQEQRPALGALYGALSARLAQSGGVNALVPQNSASHESSAQTTTPGTATLKSGRDLLDSGRALAVYLREQPLGWLAAHRLMKSLRWDTVHQAPPQDAKASRA
jgi:type VI secretion system protein VasJ